MTVKDVCDFVNRVKKNKYTEYSGTGQTVDPLVIRWLNAVENNLYKTIYVNYEGAEEFENYPESMNVDEADSCTLQAETPFDEMYPYFIMAQVDFLNREMTSFENNITQYNNLLEAYRNFINKNRKWKKATKIKYY